MARMQTAFVSVAGAAGVQFSSSVTIRGSSFIGRLQVGRRHNRADMHNEAWGRRGRANGHRKMAWSMQIVDEEEVMKIRTHEVFMPALSSTMTEGKIVQWLKAEGDFVQRGEIVMVVESDKADMDVESFDSGYIASVLVREGETCPVGSTVALLAEKKEDIEKVKKCGIDCVISGSGGRHDGTTAVDTRHIEDTPMVAPPSVVSPDSHTSSSRAPTSAPALEKPEFGEIFIPALSSTMTEGKIVDWIKSEGDAVEPGETVMVVESDKADMDVESFEKGYVAHISLPAGESAKVGNTVAYIARTVEDIPKVKAWAAAQGATEQPASAAAATSSASNLAIPSSAVERAIPSSPIQTPQTGRIIASPLAKRTAKELGVDLATVRGTGDGGRIIERDVLKAKEMLLSTAAPTKRTDGKIIATPEAEKLSKEEKIDLRTVTGTGNFGRITAQDVLRAAGKGSPIELPKRETADVRLATKPEAKTLQSSESPKAAIPEGSVPMNSLQKAIVQNMNASLNVPVFRVSYTINTTAFDEFYSKLKPKGVTISALIAKAVAITLTKHPIMNARYVEGAIAYSSDVNIAMAVALRNGGLITPVLKNADKTDLYSLSRQWKSLVKRALEKKLSPDDYNSGTFCVSNLGMYGVESFDAILPPNMGCILAVAASKPKVMMQKNGLVGVQKEMNVNITCDHRHIYGAQTAEFLRDLAGLMENEVEKLVM